MYQFTDGSGAFAQSEYYLIGKGLSSSAKGVVEHVHDLGGEDWVVLVMAVMFFIIAMVMHDGREMLCRRLNEFFSTQRNYSEEHIGNTVRESSHVFSLIAVGAVCLLFIFFDISGISESQGLSLRLRLGGLWLGLGSLWLPVLFALGLLVVVGFVYLKAALYSLVNWVFADTETSQQWQSAYFSLTALMTFVLYPVALMALWADQLHAIATASVILALFLYESLLFYKMKSNFSTKRYSYLTIFLYFCTVEIVPALVVWHSLGWFISEFIDII